MRKAGRRETNVTLTTPRSSLPRASWKRWGGSASRTAYHHPEGDSSIERFHRSLKEEEVWTAEYRHLEEARMSIARSIEENCESSRHAILAMFLCQRIAGCM